MASAPGYTEARLECLMPAASSGSQRCPLPPRIAAFVAHSQELKSAARRQVLLARELRESSATLRQTNYESREFLRESCLNSFSLQEDWLDRG